MTGPTENGHAVGEDDAAAVTGRSRIGALASSIVATAGASWTLLVTIALSASLTLLNKYIYAKLDFKYPFYLLSLHFGAIAIASRLLVRSARRRQFDEYAERVSWGFWSRNVLPVGLLYGGAILAGNLAYVFLSVHLVQMLKAFTPVIMVVVTSIIDKRLPPLRTALIVLTISGGVAFAVYGEIAFVAIGVVFQIIGSFCEVGRLIATQRLLQDLRVDPIVALSQLSPICFVMAAVLAPVFEGFEPIFLYIPRLGFLIIGISIALALTLNVAVLLLVSVTNALVLTLAGIAKDICLITGSVFFLGSHVTTLQICGYGVAACGLIYFRFGPDGKEIIDTPALGGPTEYEAVPLGPLEEGHVADGDEGEPEVVFDADEARPSHDKPPSQGT